LQDDRWRLTVEGFSVEFEITKIVPAPRIDPVVSGPQQAIASTASASASARSVSTPDNAKAVDAYTASASAYASNAGALGVGVALATAGTASISAAAQAAGVFSDDLATTFSQSSVTKGAITWTFDKNYQVGQYVTGHYFVVDPGGGVTITSTTPAWGSGNNGTVVDPPRKGGQGWDNRFETGNTYNASLSASFPLTVSVTDTPKSVVSVKSRFGANIPSPEGGSAVDWAECLTVVPSAPYTDQFRPPYVKGPKPVCRSGNLRYDILDANLFSAVSPPSIATVISNISAIWIDTVAHNTEARWYRPAQYQVNYPRDYAATINDAILLCFCSGYTQELVKHCVQLGIDYYWMAKASEAELNYSSEYTWGRSGGNLGGGKKSQAVFAAIMLDDASMRDFFAAAHRLTFQEDTQIYQATQADVDRYQSSGWTFYNSVGGLPLGSYGWGSRHAYIPTADNQFRGGYERGGSAPYIGTALWLKKTGLEAIWGHSSFVPYCGRWANNIAIPIYGANAHGWSTFERSMWNTYAAGLGF
jgi:hypothetical protein